MNPKVCLFALVAFCLATASLQAQVSSGTGTTNFIPKWTGGHSQGNSIIFQSSSSNIGIGTTSPSSKLDVRGNTSISGTLGLRAMGTANSTTAFSSHPFDQTASVFITGTGAQSQRFRWRVVPFRNNTTSGSTFLDLQFGTGTSTPTPTGLSIDRDGTLGIFTNNRVNDSALFVESLNTTRANFAVVGFADGPSGIGVAGEADNGANAIGVLGVSEGGIGVYGSTTGGLAGFFNGNVQVTGNLSKGSGSFKIDHPLDPANKYLSHSFVESPDMMNIYNGNITTDQSGAAVVVLPDYFVALNRDFRYQLTAIGQFAQVIVAREIENNRFTIKTDKPNVKVSWQVTGIRQDAYANANRINVEEDKPAQAKGHYLYPELYGAPREKSIGSALSPRLPRRASTAVAAN
jgi:hypothetical protein